MKENFLFETNDLFHGHNLSNVLDNLRHLREVAAEGSAKMYLTPTHLTLTLTLAVTLTLTLSVTLLTRTRSLTLTLTRTLEP